QLQDLFIEGDHPLGVQFAEGNFQPTAVAWDFVDAVQFKVEQFPDTQSAGALEPQGGRGQFIARGVGEDLGEPPVD
ncbi:hypothetical protein ABFP37_22610, partial [Burkholderia sp. RS01]|uniref:hypothetical protein n=1 Tax=unclassified Burkholderia TaxID=2613784 RepID=UPI00321813BE